MIPVPDGARVWLASGVFYPRFDLEAWPEARHRRKSTELKR